MEKVQQTRRGPPEIILKDFDQETNSTNDTNGGVVIVRSHTQRHSERHTHTDTHTHTHTHTYTHTHTHIHTHSFTFLPS